MLNARQYGWVALISLFTFIAFAGECHFIMQVLPPLLLVSGAAQTADNLSLAATRVSQLGRWTDTTTTCPGQPWSSFSFSVLSSTCCSLLSRPLSSTPTMTTGGEGWTQSACFFLDRKLFALRLARLIARAKEAYVYYTRTHFLSCISRSRVGMLGLFGALCVNCAKSLHTHF